MADIPIVFFGFINQLITGGHHPVGTSQRKLGFSWICVSEILGEILGRLGPGSRIPRIYG